MWLSLILENDNIKGQNISFYQQDATLRHSTIYLDATVVHIVPIDLLTTSKL